MGDTLLEVERALKSVNSFLPFAAGALQIFAPQYAVFVSPFAKLFQAATNAVDVVHQDTGKSLDQVIGDVIDHLTAGQPDAPALSSTATPPMTLIGVG